MATGRSQHVSDRLKGKLSYICRRLAVHHECQGAKWSALALHWDPSRHAVGRLGSKLAAKKLAQGGFKVSGVEPVKKAATLPTPVKRHHQARLLARAAKA